MPRRVVHAPSLEPSHEVMLVGVRSNLLQVKVPLLSAGGWTREALKVPSHANHPLVPSLSVRRCGSVCSPLPAGACGFLGWFRNERANSAGGWWLRSSRHNQRCPLPAWPQHPAGSGSPAALGPCGLAGGRRQTLSGGASCSPGYAGQAPGRCQCPARRRRPSRRAGRTRRRRSPDAAAGFLAAFPAPSAAVSSRAAGGGSRGEGAQGLLVQPGYFFRSVLQRGRWEEPKAAVPPSHPLPPSAAAHGKQKFSSSSCCCLPAAGCPPPGPVPRCRWQLEDAAAGSAPAAPGRRRRAALPCHGRAGIKTAGAFSASPKAGKRSQGETPIASSRGIRGFAGGKGPGAQKASDALGRRERQRSSLSLRPHHGHWDVLQEAEGAPADRLLPGDCGMFGLGSFPLQPLAAEGEER